MQKAEKKNFFEVRDWRVSKFPLRMLARVGFLTYMWSGVIQLTLTPEYNRSNTQMAANGLEYLTFIGFLSTTMCLIVCALHEFIPSLKAFKVGLNGFVLVIEAMITLLYWGLYFLNMDLILDPATTQDIGGPPPFFMDTAGHLIPFIAMLSEFLFTRTSKRLLYEQRVVHLLAIAIFTFGYFLWIIYLFKDNGNFPYPFLRLMSGAGRLTFTIISMFLGLFLYGIASRAYFKYHATEGDLPVYEEELYEEEDYDDDV